MRSGLFRPQSSQASQCFYESKPSNCWSHRCHFQLGNRPSNVDKSCQKKQFIRYTRIWYTWRIRKELLNIGVPTALILYPFPSLFFHGPQKINATGPDEFCSTVCSKFLGVQKFVKGVWVLTRVPIFSSTIPVTGVSASEIPFSIQFVQAIVDE